MVPRVVEFFERSGYIVFTEQYVGFRRADIISITLDEHEVQRRLEHGVHRLPIRTLLRIMRVLDRQGEVSIKELAKILGYSSNYIRSIVVHANPLYLLINNGVIRKISDYVPFTRDTIAVEVKVKNWKRGLIQASQYLLATHKSYLAVYEKTYERISNDVLKWIENKGVGILTVNKDGIVEERIPAKRSGPRSRTAHYKFVESLWDKVLNIIDHLSR